MPNTPEDQYPPVLVELRLSVTDGAALAEFARSAGFPDEDVERGAAWCATVLLQSIVNGSVPGLHCDAAAGGSAAGELTHRSGYIDPDALLAGEYAEEPF